MIVEEGQETAPMVKVQAVEVVATESVTALPPAVYPVPDTSLVIEERLLWAVLLSV